MDELHNEFRREFNMLIEYANDTYTGPPLPLDRYLSHASMFREMLNLHHATEEDRIFPMLAQRMPQFSPHSEGHVQSHHKIHAGLNDLSKLVSKWRDNPEAYSPTEMKNCLESFREILFRHLDEEVEDLKGENLRQHFTLNEIEKLLPRYFR
ncbi:hypothetical protein AMATHDRAFT_58955 [Amanita thiersii Skay4041]|uniref:Hemerythrin-like domain-containing protein n=1 Tax=Amanita thiersii Skay4041 TaxID=703135 RepID=A0A2A9NN43_9AGAR|nr:hypothetical protein AMATHDRAFT_58955 [Amanita thiersii Skay4041]